MAWSASIPVKWSVLGKIPWHWSIVIYSSNVSWHDFGPFKQALSLNNPWTGFGSSSRQFAHRPCSRAWNSLLGEIRNALYQLGLPAWRYLWIHLIWCCGCSPRESCSHMWKTEWTDRNRVNILAEKDSLRGRNAQDNVPFEMTLLHCLF